MAYDKAVDSTALETGLTTIADAIRAKGGTSAPLEFPQGMADAVAAISGGGGGMPFNWGIKSGEFTSVSEEYPFTVQHNCGTVPQYFCLWDTKYQNCPIQCFNFVEIYTCPLRGFQEDILDKGHALLLCRGQDTELYGDTMRFNGGTWFDITRNLRTAVEKITASELVLVSRGQYARPLKLGEQYRWLAIWDKEAPNG